MSAETKLDKLLNIESAMTLYDEVAGILYEIALLEPDDTATDVVCKIAVWLSNRSDVLADEEIRIYDSLLSSIERGE